MKTRNIIWLLIVALVVYALFTHNDALNSTAFIIAGFYCLILRKQVLSDTLEAHKKRSKRFPLIFPAIKNEEGYYKSGNVLSIIVGAGFVLFGVLTLLYPTTLQKSSYQPPSGSANASSTPSISAATSSTPNPLTIPRGNKIGYLTNVRDVGSNTYIDFKEIQLFYGQAAYAPMRADGKCYIQPGDTNCFMPDGYYIRTLNEPTSTLEIASSAKIVVWAICTGSDQEAITITLNQFVNGYGSLAPSSCKTNPTTNYYIPNDTPYWINQNQSGQATLIWEQYVP